MSNYATKTDLKNYTLLKRLILSNIKCDIDKLDIDKLKNVTSNLSSLKSQVGKLDVDKLVPVPVE